MFKKLQGLLTFVFDFIILKLSVNDNCLEIIRRSK